MKMSDETKLGILTAICMLVSVVTFKNILHIQPPFMASYGVVGIFILYIILKYSMEEELKSNSLYRGKSIAFYYSLTIIFVTVATIILYAFF